MNRPTRTALITGANRGIGLAVSKRLASRHEIKVLVAARTSEAAGEAAREVGNGAEGVVLDLSEPRLAEELARAIDAKHGPVDILVNNAGVLIPGLGLEVTTDALQESLAVNTIAAFSLIRALAPGMKARRWGRIVNVSSGWGSFEEGLCGPTAYAISKASLNAVSLGLASHLGTAVKINAACPGWVRTRMGGQAAERSPEQGADTPVWLATLPDDGPTGGFFRDRRLIEW